MRRLVSWPELLLSSTAAATAASPCSVAAAVAVTPRRAAMVYSRPTTTLSSDGIDFCFHVNLRKAPPPPTAEMFGDGSVASSVGTDAAGGGVFSMQDYVSTVPSFFIPTTELLKHLEGYTEAHLDMYFSRNRGVELIAVGGTRFIRLFGGYTKLDMNTTYEAAALYPQFKPNPAAAEPFVRCFQGVTNTWMPLRMLIQRAGPAAEEALPFRGMQTLLYFSQMQHLFGFASDNGGAVQLRDARFDGLDISASPCPGAMATIMDALGDDMVDFDGFMDTMVSEEHRKDMLYFFPTLAACIKKHRPVFYLDEQTNMLMRSRVKEREDLKKLPLEQQLEVAMSKGDKRRARNLRKKIAIQNNPDNPLLEKDNLAREVFNYLPKNGYVPLITLARKALPLEYLDLMGRDHIKFFKNYPQYFQVFELEVASKWCVARAGVQLPQGVLRQEYTEEEALRIIAAVIQRKGTHSAGGITLLVPAGVREMIKRQYGGIYFFCAKYPQYFSVMKRSETENASSSAAISLLQMPSEGSGSAGGSNGGGGSDDNDDEYDA